MSDLRKAAEQALDALEAMMAEFKALDLPYGSKAYALAKDARLDLRAALAESTVPSDCPYSHQPTPKPVCDECGKSKTEGWALYCVDCMEPVFGQRKPLTDEEIRELSQQHKFHERMEKFVRIIERAHGIGGKYER